MLGVAMADRVSAAQRVTLQSVAEAEIKRFAGDHVAWHKHVLNVDLDPIQQLKMELMDEYPFTLDPSCRRTRKTSTKELYHLEKMACESDHELSITAPKEDQANVNLKYHTDAIRSSPILTAYIATKEGKRRIADTSYEFANGSIAKTYGITSRMDGADTTIADVEEIDDVDPDRLWGRFMLTLQGTQRLYQKRPGNIKKTARFTGVFQGADLMVDLCRKAEHHPWNRKMMAPMLRAMGVDPEAAGGEEIEGFRFYCLPVIDVHQALTVELVNQTVVDMVSAGLTRDQYVRQLLCIPTEGRNFFKEKHLRLMMRRGGMAGCEPVPPGPGKQYQKRGLIIVCFDKGGHGESESASRNAAHVLEVWNNYIVWLWGKEWPADADDAPIARELVEWFRFFRFDGGCGDAYGTSLITAVNDELKDRGLIDIDRREFGGSSASTWEKWFFSPIRMEGMTKHLMFTSLEREIRAGRFLAPYVHDGNKHLPGYELLNRTMQQFGNIKAEKTSKTYDSYSMVEKKLGDDNVDAWAFGVWRLITRGIIEPPTVITGQAVDRARLVMGSGGSVLNVG
jgi:hypothetical protein